MDQGRSSSFPVVEKMGNLVFEKLRYPKLDVFPAYYDEYNDLSFHTKCAQDVYIQVVRRITLFGNEFLHSLETPPFCPLMQ